MTTWKQTQTILAPSLPESVLPRNTPLITRTRNNQIKRTTFPTCVKLHFPYKRDLRGHRQAIHLGPPSSSKQKHGITLGRSAQPQPFPAAAARVSSSSSNLHAPFAGLRAARGELQRARNLLAVIRLHRTAKRLLKLSSILARGRAIIFFPFLFHYNVMGLNRRIRYMQQ